MTRRVGLSLALLVLLLAAAPAGIGRAQDTPIDLIKVADVVAMLKKGSKVTIVDVRSRQEYLARHIPGSLSVPLDTVELRAAEIPRQGLVVLY